MVIINNNDAAQTVNWQDYQEVLQDAVQGKDIISDKSIRFDKNIIIPAKTGMIIEIKN